MRGPWRRGTLAAVSTAAALLVVPAQASAVSFFRGDFPVGTDPTSVAVGNFNGGPPDLAVANEGSDDVSILLGNGFGQFTASTPVSVGDAPSSLITGSFNGDAFTDLAVASVGDDNVAIRLGDGTGAFTGTGTVTTGSGSDPRSIAAGDFNGDGITDLVSANSGNSTVAFLLGDGMGDFAADATPFDADAGGAANPVSVAVGRIENPAPPGTPDPDLDAFIASPTDDQVLFLLNEGDGEITGWGTLYTAMGLPGRDPSAVAIGSLNPDSSNPGFAAEPDLITANPGVDQLFPYYGRIDGTSFDPGGVLATEADPVAVAFGDVDGDGDDDVISANSGAGSATVVLSDGNGGTSVDTSTPIGSSPRAVATGGFDADTRADAVLANYDSNSVTALTSLQPGPPASVPTTPPDKAKKKCKNKKGKKRSAGAAKKKCKKKKKKR